MLNDIKEEIHHLRDGQLVIYKRERSKKWQARMKLRKGGWVRFSTKESELKRAKEVAGDRFDEARYNQKHGKAEVSKRFDSIAKQAIVEMQDQLSNNTGKTSYKDYIAVIQKYLIPYFGSRHIDNIKPNEYRNYQAHLASLLQKQLPRSTITTHNSALNRIFDIAVINGWLGKSQVPVLQNNGEASQRRPAFSKEEYMRLTKHLKAWSEGGVKTRSQMVRRMLRDYVLIAANTGARPGTELDNLKWKDIEWFVHKGQKYLRLHVKGKTGSRQPIARHNCEKYFKRIQQQFEDLKAMTFDQLLQGRLDRYVFRLEDGGKLSLNQNFEEFLKAFNLLQDPVTGQNRTLYSLRHTYATFALLEDKFSIHKLAIQMGTSVPMIERHYSHLVPSMNAEVLAGERFEDDD